MAQQKRDRSRPAPGKGDAKGRRASDRGDEARRLGDVSETDYDPTIAGPPPEEEAKRQPEEDERDRRERAREHAERTLGPRRGRRG